MSSSTIAIVITGITFILFLTNKFPFSAVSLLSALAMGMLIPEMKLSQIYSGFGSNTLLLVAGMCFVGNAMFQTGAVQRMGKVLCKTPIVKNERVFIVAVVIIITVQSAFMSNSGTIAMWMPLIATIAAASNGKIRSKMVIFPAGCAAVFGGCCTLVGAPAQVNANAILMGTPGYEAGMGVFEMTKVMIPVSIIHVLFWGTIGYTMLEKVLKPNSPDFNKGNVFADASSLSDDTLLENGPRWKQNLSIAVMLLCILGFMVYSKAPFSNYLDLAVVPMIGSTILLITGCVPAEESFKMLPWDTLVTVGTVNVLGTGLSVSGGGEIIANSILDLIGMDNMSPAMLMVAALVMCGAMTLFLQNGGVAAMMTPIFIAMALKLGLDPTPYVVAIGIAVGLAIATPIGTAVNLQILPAGYKTRDFVLLGGPLWIVLVVALCILCPIIYL